MLSELRVRDLGVIAELALELGPGMTAVTGETGAGKTLVVEAIELLVGGRADPVLVRPGAAEAVVEGRFVGLATPGGGPGSEATAGDHGESGEDDGREDESGGDGSGEDERILRRTVPVGKRSRAYLDGAMVPVSVLAEVGRALVDLHGQHAHQALLSASAQRAALDDFAGVDLRPRDEARARLVRIDEALAAVGGDGRARAREVDLLRHQVAEIDAAGLADADEDEVLAVEEQRLSGASASRHAAATAHELISGDGGAGDVVASALAAVAGNPALAGLEASLRSVVAELAETGGEARRAAEELEDDPERLQEVQARRQLLRDLRRRYGDTLADVLAFAEDARRRLGDLEAAEERAAALGGEREAAVRALRQAEAAVGCARRAAAPDMAKAVERELRDLAMPRARLEVRVGDGAPAVGDGDLASGDGEAVSGEAVSGEAVAFLLGANPGEPLLPLARVASGGELARAMLALRLVMQRATLHDPGGQAEARDQGRVPQAPGADRGAQAGAGSPGPSGPPQRADRSPVPQAPGADRGAQAGAGSRGPSGPPQRADRSPVPQAPGADRGAQAGAGRGPGTLVFDEVDAGIGGEAALAVGRALASVAADRQVLVVTHLPQVAAFADAQVAVRKDEHGGRTRARAEVLTPAARVVELSRMLSGSPGSASARHHAEELLATAAAERSEVRGRRRSA